MNAKNIFASLAFILLNACVFSDVMDYRKPEAFADKTGVIGFLELPDNFCNGWDNDGTGSLLVGEKRISFWPDERGGRDGLFAFQMDPGTQRFLGFDTRCHRNVGTEKKPKFEFKDVSLKPDNRTSIKIPVDGFCKIILSLKNGEPIVRQNDELLRDVFETQGTAIEFDDIPYCDVRQISK